MHHKTLYVFPVLEHRQIYFSSPLLEEPEYAAYRFFKMHHFQFNSRDETRNFFEPNSDLYFSARSNRANHRHTEARCYIFSSEGGLIAKFYNVSSGRWITFYQGPWYAFVNQFGTIAELLYPMKLSVQDSEFFYLTFTEVEILIENFRAQTTDQKRWQRDADFLEIQLEDFFLKKR